MTGAPAVGEVVGGGSEDGDAVILREVCAGKIAGRVGVIDGEDAWVEGKGNIIQMFAMKRLPCV